VHAIGQQEKDPLSGEVLASFPIPLGENIYFCGFANEATFGASSYLITRPAGNVLVDVPQFYPKLIQGIEGLGGVKYIFLTHIDDIAGHAEFAAHFGAERIMHDAERMPPGIEKPVAGNVAIPLTDDLTIIPRRGIRAAVCACFTTTGFFFRATISPRRVQAD
jgi:glyoxylase-like metal-dependent hydrolase (beta-lactamase superfamily II)